MGKYFGTDGFRGEANVKLNVEHAFKVGRYLGWYYGQLVDEQTEMAAAGADTTDWATPGDRGTSEFPRRKARIVIGKDTRRSSYMFEYALAAGLTASGADAYLLHATTTPSVSYVVRTEDFDCGIMISASHNPYYDNGLKIISGSGKKIEAEVEDKIEAYIDGKLGELPLATGVKIGRTVDHQAGRNRYIGHLISLATRSYKNTKVGLDCSNGSSSSIAKSVFDALGAKTYVIHNEPDGTNINRDCGSTHIETLKKFVLENGLDVGFAYDGDADRCIAVDSNGRIINGDLILYVCGKYLKENGQLENNTVVTTVMSNIGLYKAFEREGIRYEKTAVGDKYVYANMCENGHCLGGEQSGHIIFSKYATTGDGILTSIMVMEVMMDKKRSLASLASEVEIYPQLLKNVRVADKAAVKANAAVQAAIEAAGEALGDEGRILVRESGTEPVIRVMAEAKTDELCAQHVDAIIKVMKEQGLVQE
ncbi:MAG: phosphoglucosamine mutase [Clostridiales bacterium]|nr:phosphoglucosamine mutase [Clostridiales bacterium]